LGSGVGLQHRRIGEIDLARGHAVTGKGERQNCPPCSQGIKPDSLLKGVDSAVISPSLSEV